VPIASKRSRPNSVKPAALPRLNVRDRVAVEKMVAGLAEPFRRINVVVANAGHGIGMQLAQQASITDWEEW